MNFTSYIILESLFISIRNLKCACFKTGSHCLICFTHPLSDSLRAASHFTISMRGQRETGKTQMNNYHSVNGGPL